ncbi:MAG TPA: hypothetical protein VHS29_11605 [Candidatus Acidoferrales bacterium]|jgi:hypothetical protein|nr:hypothetical protein [Candidatus Acidoferrales bacterium]
MLILRTLTEQEDESSKAGEEADSPDNIKKFEQAMAQIRANGTS